MAGSCGSLSLAKRLLVRTLAQYDALGKCPRKPKVSFNVIQEWFSENKKSSGPEQYQPSKSSMCQLISGADSGRHRTAKNVLALRMWMAQHNSRLPGHLQDDEWGVPEWYSESVSEDVLGSSDDGEVEGECGGGGAAEKRAASESPPREPRERSAHAPGCDSDGDEDETMLPAGGGGSDTMPVSFEYDGSSAPSADTGTDSLETPSKSEQSADLMASTSARRGGGGAEASAASSSRLSGQAVVVRLPAAVLAESRG